MKSARPLNHIATVGHIENIPQVRDETYVFYFGYVVQKPSDKHPFNCLIEFSGIGHLCIKLKFDQLIRYRKLIQLFPDSFAMSVCDENLPLILYTNPIQKVVHTMLIEFFKYIVE